MTDEQKEETIVEEQGETKGASLDEAIEQALTDLEGKKDEPAAEADKTPDPEAEQDDSQPSKEPEPAPAAPAEWSKEEKEDFAGLSRKQQDAALRLYKSNREAFQRYQRDKAESQKEFAEVRALADSVLPFIKATGKQGKNPYQAVQEAIAVVQEIRENPALFRALEAARKSGVSGTKQPDPEISTLQNEIKSLKEIITGAQTDNYRQQLGDAYSAVRAETNGAGKAKFPDLNDTEEGIKLSGLVGSAIRSEEFRAAVRARKPNASLQDMVIEAYRWHGGKVDDSPAPEKQNVNGSPQEHVKKAAKAAVSKPGRAPISAGANPKKFKTLDAALEAALADLE